MVRPRLDKGRGIAGEPKSTVDEFLERGYIPGSRKPGYEPEHDGCRRRDARFHLSGVRRNCRFKIALHLPAFKRRGEHCRRYCPHAKSSAAASAIHAPGRAAARPWEAERA